MRRVRAKSVRAVVVAAAIAVVGVAAVVVVAVVAEVTAVVVAVVAARAGPQPGDTELPLAVVPRRGCCRPRIG